jgi:hypothetical protein
MIRKSAVVTVPIPGIGAFPKASRENLKALRVAFAFVGVTSGMIVLRFEVVVGVGRLIVAGWIIGVSGVGPGVTAVLGADFFFLKGKGIGRKGWKGSTYYHRSHSFSKFLHRLQAWALTK